MRIVFCGAQPGAARLRKSACGTFFETWAWFRVDYRQTGSNPRLTPTESNASFRFIRRRLPSPEEFFAQPFQPRVSLTFLRMSHFALHKITRRRRTIVPAEVQITPPFKSRLGTDSGPCLLFTRKLTPPPPLPHTVSSPPFNPHRNCIFYCKV